MNRKSERLFQLDSRISWATLLSIVVNAVLIVGFFATANADLGHLTTSFERHEDLPWHVEAGEKITRLEVLVENISDNNHAMQITLREIRDILSGQSTAQ